MSRESDILPTQKAELYRAIEAAGLNPAHFKWDMDGMGYSSSNDTPVLKHTETAYYFQILTPDNFRSHGFRGRVSPGASSNEFILKEDVAWERMVQLFTHWLGWLKRELAVADPWAALEQQRILAPTLVAYNQTANRPFTVVEAKKIENTLGQLVEKLEQVFPDVLSKVTNLELQVQSLVLAAQEGRGRIDWANQFVGFLLHSTGFRANQARRGRWRQRDHHPRTGR